MDKNQILEFLSGTNLYSLERKFDCNKAFSNKATYDIRESDVFVEIINKKTRATFSFINLSEEIEAGALFRVRVPKSETT